MIPCAEMSIRPASEKSGARRRVKSNCIPKGEDMTDNKRIMENRYYHLEWNSSGEGLTVLRKGGRDDGLNFLASGKEQDLGTVSLTCSCPDAEKTPAAETESCFRFSEGDGKELIWEIAVRNAGDSEIVIDDLKLPLQMNTLYVADAKVNYTQRLVRHAYISGNASVLYWQRPDGVFPALVMLCGDDTYLVDCELDSSD